jgi:hypothetical protein
MSARECNDKRMRKMAHPRSGELSRSFSIWMEAALDSRSPRKDCFPHPGKDEKLIKESLDAIRSRVKNFRQVRFRKFPVL